MPAFVVTPTASLTYGNTEDAEVELTIYDLFGHLVKTMGFAKGAAGGQIFTNTVTWDGANDIGEKVAKGGYLCRIVVKSSEGNVSVIRKIGVIH